MPAMVKRQQIEGNKNNATKQRVSKRGRVDKNENEEGQSSYKYYGKDDIYVLFFVF